MLTVMLPFMDGARIYLGINMVHMANAMGTWLSHV